MKNTNLIIAAVAALIVGAAGGFFGGMQYEKSKVPANNFRENGNSPAPGQNGRTGRFGGNGAGRSGAIAGEILSTDDTSLTVKLADGSSKIVLLTAKTTISKSSTGSKSDLTNGVKVAVFGTSNSDGSVTATNVQINPVMRTGTQNNNQQK